MIGCHRDGFRNGWPIAHSSKHFSSEAESRENPQARPLPCVLGQDSRPVPGTLATASAPAAAADKSPDPADQGRRGRIRHRPDRDGDRQGRLPQGPCANADLLPGESADSAATASAKADAFLDKYARRSARSRASWCASGSLPTARLDRGLHAALQGRARLRRHAPRPPRPRRRPDRRQRLRGHPTSTSPPTPSFAARSADRAVALPSRPTRPASDGEPAKAEDSSRRQPTLMVYRTGIPRRRRRQPASCTSSRSPTAPTSATSSSSTRRPASCSTATRWSTTRSTASSTRRTTTATPPHRQWGGRPTPRGTQRGPAEPRRGDRRVLLVLPERLRPDSYDGAGLTMRTVNNDPAHRLPERQLERHHDELLQRRHLRRRRRTRVGPRLHRVHQRPHLPVAAGCAQRVLLRHLGRDRRPDQRPDGRRRG